MIIKVLIDLKNIFVINVNAFKNNQIITGGKEDILC